jgi:hypothetical protein
VTTDPRQYCPARGSGHTYWTFTSVDGDFWDCGSCGQEWTVEVVEMTTHKSGNRAGDDQPGKTVDLVREALSGSYSLTRDNVFHAA